MTTYSSLRSRPAEEKARIKENENILRFETYAILKGIQPLEEMKVRVRQACRNFYEANPDEIDVPKDVLMEAGFKSHVELNI